MLYTSLSHTEHCVSFFTDSTMTPEVQVPPKTFDDAQVAGKNRYKFFKRPIIPFLQQIPPEVMLATARSVVMATLRTFIIAQRSTMIYLVILPERDI